MGGTFVLQLAKEAGAKVSAAVPCYPVGAFDLGDVSSVTAKVALHVGGDDAFGSVDLVEQLAGKLRAAGADVTVHSYPGKGHAFLNDENLLGTYDKEAADLLWKRTVDFLQANVA